MRLLYQLSPRARVNFLLPPPPPPQGLATALAESNKHPQHACFDLPGDDAHVRVTGLGHWPSVSYTWVMWFRTSDQAVPNGPVPLYWCAHPPLILYQRTSPRTRMLPLLQWHRSLTRQHTMCVAAGRSLHGVDAQTGVMGGLENGAFVLHSVCATKPVETLRVQLSGENSGTAASVDLYHPVLLG